MVAKDTTPKKSQGKSQEEPEGKTKPFATPPMWVIPWISRTHVALYKLTKGKVGGSLAGHPGILIRTIGRKSGKPHTVCLPYIPDDEKMIVVASYAGAEKNPDWLKNIKSSPEIIIRNMEKAYWANAEILSGATHTKKWKEVIEKAPWYAEYQEKTTRQIPLVRLSFSRPYIN